MKSLILKIWDSLICVLIFSLIFQGCGTSPSVKKTDTDSQKVSNDTKSSSDEWLQVKNKSVSCKIWNRNPQPNESASWSGDCKDGFAKGYGKLQWYKDGVADDKYEGELKDGKQHGRGTEIWTNGAKYEGEFQDNKRHGRGTYYFANGDKYEGEWNDNKQSGRGTYYYADGGKYEGEWKDGKRNGKGTAIEANGYKYEGDFKDGRWHGMGILTVDTFRYEGGYNEGKEHGRGTYYFANGSIYEGEFKNGEKVDGKGKWTYANRGKGGASDSDANAIFKAFGAWYLESMAKGVGELLTGKFPEGGGNSSSSSLTTDREARDSHNKICEGIKQSCLAPCQGLSATDGGYFHSSRTKCSIKCDDAYDGCKK